MNLPQTEEEFIQYLKKLESKKTPICTIISTIPKEPSEQAKREFGNALLETGMITSDE